MYLLNFAYYISVMRKASSGHLENRNKIPKSPASLSSTHLFTQVQDVLLPMS